MADQVEEVKQKTDIVSLIGEYITLKRAGRNYKAPCPFHSEKTPSFMVSPELQIYKCFGCGEAGDVFNFLEKYEGLEFSEALKILADRAGVKLISFKPGETDEKTRLYELNNLAAKFYHYILLNHPVGKLALNYLTKERGLKMETIKQFQLGFSPTNYGVLKSFLITKKKFMGREVEKAGIGFPKGTDLIDRFRGRVIFPLFDHRGQVVGFAGRILPGGNQEMAKYINTPETPVYHKSNMLFGLNFVKSDIKQNKIVVIVEGELDMISSWQAGIKNVVAIKGSALTEEQVRLISRFAGKIILALDSDFAGDAAARRGIAIAQKQGLEVRVAKFEKYKDPDEAARADIEYYKKSLDNSVGVWDFLIDSTFAKYDRDSGEGQAKISSEVVPVLSSIPDRIVQAHYINLVAGRLKVPVEAVVEQIGEIKESDVVKKIEIPVKNAEKTRRQLLEERLMTLAFQTDPKILLTEKVFNLIVTPLTKRLLEEYKRFTENHKTFSPSEFSENLPKELVNAFAEMTLRDLEDLVESPDEVGKEQKLVVKELEIVDIRHKLEVVGAKIRKFEESGETDKLEKAQELFGKMTQKLSGYEDEAGEGIILQEE